MRTTWTFHSAGHLVFGSGAAAQLGQLVRDLGAERVLIVTDRILLKAGPYEAVSIPLIAAGLEVETFDGGLPEPSLALAEQAIEMAQKFRPDAVLGLGGGSNMDLAKVVALVLTHGGSVRDHVGDGRVPGPVLPIVCVPTTSGTGSEVTAVVGADRHGTEDQSRHLEQSSPPAIGGSRSATDALLPGQGHGR